MNATGSWSVLLLCLQSCLLHPSLAFSLKNCTVTCSANDVLIDCRDRYLTAVPDDIPKSATGLDLSSNTIVEIARTDLRGLSQIKGLQFQYNLISRVDDGAFTDLTELKFLNMDNNKLTNIRDNMFQGLSKLHLLSLYGNQISHISPVAFQSLVNIETVIMGANHLHQITDIVSLLKQPTLEKLMIGYNRFTSFQSDDLPLNVSHLKVLQLSMNPLRKFSITKDIFPNLQSLDFCKCSSDLEWDVSNKTFLQNLTSLAFSGSYMSFETYTEILQTVDSLEKLTLYFMKESEQEGLIDVACQIPSLRGLYLSNSGIGTVDDKLLWSCSRLSELSLSSNSLSEMSEHSLKSMTQLKLLDLGMNQLSKPPLALRGLSTLETLDLHSNFISMLDCLDFHNLTRLKNLDLNNNRISKLQGCVFENLNELEVLNIEKNALYVVDNTFRVNLGKLKSLNLQNNGHLQLMQGDFWNLSSLTVLNLESNVYYNVYEGAFEGLNNLQTLTVSLSTHNEMFFTGLPHLENLLLHLTFNWEQKSFQQNDEPPFSNLTNLKKLALKVYDSYTGTISPDLFKGLKSLEYLQTDKFFMKGIHPDTFKYTPRLRGLQITNSHLSALDPELFSTIPNLQALDISYNNFRSLDFLTHANLQTLSWLKASDNKLSIISADVLQSLPALTYLDLSGNPLTCECSNSGFNQWVLSNNQTQVINGHQYTCAFPVSQQGSKFLDFDVSSCWLDASFFYFLSSSFLVLFTLLSSFIYHFLRFHLAYAYYLLLAFLYDKKKKKEGTPYQYDAFVSYNIQDEAWVFNELLPALEEQQGWSLCLHHRDFEPGRDTLYLT